MSGAKQKRGDVVEGEGGYDEHGGDPERDLDKATGDGTRARGAIGAGAPRLPIHEVETVSEEARRSRDEERLVRRERRKVADPGAADAEAEQDERNDAAGRGRERAENAADRDQALPTGVCPLRLCKICRDGCRICCSRSRCHHVRPLFLAEILTAP